MSPSPIGSLDDATITIGICLRRLSGSVQRGRTSGRKDDIDFQLDQVLRQSREPLFVSFSIATLDDDVLTFAPAKVAQPLKERINDPYAATDVQNADPGFLARLLPLRGERRGKEATRASKKCASVHQRTLRLN